MNEKEHIEPDYYLTIQDTSRAEIKIKGSRFIGTISPVVDKANAEQILIEIRKEFHNATHNCFAYRINAQEFRYSDDGEPSGTAGRPVLSMIDKHQLQRTVLVVTRYFGGTKLGTGGLIRAYSQSAESVIFQANISKKYNYIKLTIEYPFEMVSKVQQLRHRYHARIKETATTGGMKGHLEILPSKIAAFKKELLAYGTGKVQIKNP